MKTFVQLLKREFKRFWSNSVLRLLFFGAPLFYGILIGYVYKKGKVTDLPIIVVDEDQSSLSAKIIEMLEDHEVLSIAAVQYDDQNLDRKLIALQATSVVRIPKGFEKGVLTKKHPEITTIVNTANILTANYTSSAIQVVLGTLKAGMQWETLRKQGTPESLLDSQYEAFQTTFIKKNNRSTNYLYFLWPGVLATILQQVMLMGLALSFASEFENKQDPDWATLSSSTGILILVKIVPYLLMSFMVWLMYGLFTLWFKIPFAENLGNLTWVAGLFVLSVSFMGILVSIWIPNQLKATEVLMAIATPSFMISGFTWPLSQMPIWIQWLAQIIPLTHFLEAFRVLMVENGTIDLIYLPLLKMLLIAFICFLGSYLGLHIKMKKRLHPAPLSLIESKE